jgi:membrane-associated protease RseP (regulator of RpoE activity)
MINYQNTQDPMPVLQVILILALLIFVHELGHFLAARLQGIYANRFSIGFGPVLWRYQGSQTEYALRALPLGGFVGFPDDDPDSDIDPNDPNLLRNRPWVDRAIVISAGVIANLLFAYFILTTQAFTVGIPHLNFNPGAALPQVMEGSIAQKAGLQKGDVVLKVNEMVLPGDETSADQLRKAIEASFNQPLNLQIQRDGKPLIVNLTPEMKDGKGRIGIALAPNARVDIQHPSNPIAGLVLAGDELSNVVNQTVQGFGKLITNFGATSKQVAGPVEIVRQGARIAERDWKNLFGFTVLISVNLAVMNILPLPALDGGQLVFIILEALRGKPVPKRFEEGFMQTGLVLLLSLGVILIIRDTANWIQQ